MTDTSKVAWRRGVVWGRGVLCATLAGFALAGLPKASSAQMQSDSVTVSLDDAIAMARRANPAFRRAENALDQNVAERRATLFNQILPRASVNLLNTSYRGNLSFNATDPFGDPIANPNAEWAYFSNTGQSLSLNWTIQGSSIFNVLRGQNLQEAGRSAALSSADRELTGGLQTQYFAALQELALLEVEESLAEGRGIDLVSANRRFELAQASQVDVLNAGVQVDQQSIAVTQARSRYEQALLTLRTTIGDPDAPPLRVALPELPVFDPSSIDADALISRALGANPRIAENAVQVDQAQLGLTRTGERWWPSINLNYILGRQSQAREVAAFVDLTHERTDLSSNFQISVSLPFLNNYFQDDLNAAQARIQLANARESAKESELEIERSVRSGLIDLKNQYASLQLAQRSADVAGQASEMARQEYQIGTRTFEQLQQTLEQESDALRSVIQAQFGFVNALLTLESAVGAPIGPGAN